MKRSLWPALHIALQISFPLAGAVALAGLHEFAQALPPVGGVLRSVKAVGAYQPRVELPVPRAAFPPLHEWPHSLPEVPIRRQDEPQMLPRLKPPGEGLGDLWHTTTRLPSPPPMGAAKAQWIDQWLAQGAQASGGWFGVIHITRVADPARSSLYYVQSHGAVPRYIDTVQDLMAEIHRVGLGTQAESVYLYLDGPSPAADARALELSLRPLPRQVQTLLVLAPRLEESWRHLLEQRLDTFDLAGPARRPAQLAAQGPVYLGADGLHHLDVVLDSRTERTPMSIVSTSPAWLTQLYRILQQLLSQLTARSDRSYLAVVQQARVQLARDLGVSLADVDRELTINVQQSQIAARPLAAAAA